MSGKQERTGTARVRFRSDLPVMRNGRFRFDGFVEAGRKPPPDREFCLVELRAGERFPRLDHACWWTPLDDDPAKRASESENEMISARSPAALRNGMRI